jgi:3-carboxy-cis,cis-muconate cycloisomerase
MMTVSPFDSVIYRELLQDDEAAELLNDAAELRAMIRVEAALARVQGELGLIPAASAREIYRAISDAQIDPASLAATTRRDGVPVPALVAALRAAMGSNEHAQYLHWGATSQDIMDTGLILRLQEICNLLEQRLKILLQALADKADVHTELPMAARTRAQIATPTSFGAVIAAWGSPLLNHLEVLAQLKPRLLRVSLAGASGNSTALGDKVSAVRTALAAELELGESTLCWHSDRSTLVEFASLLTRINGSLAKMAEDIILATQPEVAELRLKQGGGSSTMPQKNNPVVAETLVSLFRLSAAMEGLMTQAMPHRQQRDGAAWALEWHALPQICMASAKALTLALDLARELQPNASAMEAHLSSGNGLVYAEAISFKLAETMPRPEAQDQVKRLCAQALEQGCLLAQLVAQTYPDTDWSVIATPAAQLGDAPQQAHAFVTRVRQLK